MSNQTVLQHRSYTFKNDICFISFTQMSYGQAEKIYHWRNHKEIRKWMFNQKPIKLENHFRYLAQLSGQHQKFYWLVGDAGRPLGVVKLKTEGGRFAEWGFYMNPDHLGSDLAINLIYHTLNFFFETLQFDEVCSYLRVENKEMIRLYDLFGIREDIMEQRQTHSGPNWYFKRLITREEWENRTCDLEEVKMLFSRKVRQQKGS